MCGICLPAIFDSQLSCAAIVPISLAGGSEEFVEFGFLLSDSRLSRGEGAKLSGSTVIADLSLWITL
jgi:hypothetical protein